MDYDTNSDSFYHFPTVRYSQVISDYFRDFRKGFSPHYLGGVLACVFFALIVTREFLANGGLLENGSARNWLAGLPLLFALISASSHFAALPPMMYLVPLSRREREDYLQKMLAVKVLIPLLFALFCDFATLAWQPISWYVLVLQLLGVASITYLCGMLQGVSVSGTFSASKNYGNLRSDGAFASFGASGGASGNDRSSGNSGFSSVIVSFCYIGGTVLFAICSDSISTIEFWWIFAVLAGLMLPTVIFTARRWKRLRRRLAECCLPVC